MPFARSRRVFLNRCSVIATAALLGRSPLRGSPADDAWTAHMAELEARVSGRLGVAMLDQASLRSWQYRAHERFPLCSTFKLLAAAAILAKADRGELDLVTKVPYGVEDLVTHSPITEKHAGGVGLSWEKLCAATMTLSDNTAANLILRELGGPGAIGAFAKTLRDGVTRLDRWETALNEGTPGDPRDTTCPANMAANLCRLLTENHLRASSQALLTQWLRDCQTGGGKLRAGLPTDWTIGSKTGGGGYGSTNEVAVICPSPDHKVFVAVYLTECSASIDARNAVIADVARSLPGLLQ